MPLLSYGENSATFLVFKALSEDPKKLRKFLKSLRPAGGGEYRVAVDEQDEDPVVWLFPNFGKRDGFGEPDVLILIGGHSFWIEVETKINLRSGRIPAQHSLLQLARFYLLHQAMARGARVRGEMQRHMAILGPTVTNSGKVKYGVLKMRAHLVLREHFKRVVESKAHFVLMSIRQAAGVGAGGPSFGVDLANLAKNTFSSINDSLQEWKQEKKDYSESIPQLPPKEPIWYTYWYGHAIDESGLKDDDPLTAGGWGGKTRANREASPPPQEGDVPGLRENDQLGPEPAAS